MQIDQDSAVISASRTGRASATGPSEHVRSKARTLFPAVALGPGQGFVNSGGVDGVRPFRHRDAASSVRPELPPAA